MFTLPPLTYGYEELEPYIDVQTMFIHHTKHHATYVKNLNEVLNKHRKLLEMNVDDLIKSLDMVPEEIKIKVRNNAGGHANHSLFWKTMCPTQKYKSLNGSSKLDKKIMANLGSWSGFQEEFNFNAMQIFGSGWTWLVINPESDRLEIVNTQNQESPLMYGKTPILGLDVWEHAYYLKYLNKRLDYINAWWNIVDWAKVEENFEKATNNK